MEKKYYYFVSGTIHKFGSSFFYTDVFVDEKVKDPETLKSLLLAAYEKCKEINPDLSFDEMIVSNFILLYSLKTIKRLNR